MKSKGIQRSVRAQRFSRSAGDAPNLGRVPRLRNTQLKKELSKHRKMREDGSPEDLSKQGLYRRNVLLAWSLMLVLAALGVLTFFIWSWLKPQIGQASSLEQNQGEVTDQKRIASRFSSPSEGVALEVVKQGVAAREMSEVERYFRMGSARPEEVIDFLEGLATMDGPVTDFLWLSSMDANGLLIDGVLVSSTKDGLPRNRLALLTPNESGVWQIDFEAFARTTTPSWDELMKADGPVRGVVRVIIARDSYFNGPFKDDQLWESYGMASPDSDLILLGYCRKGSSQAKALERIFTEDKNATGQRLNRVTLELKRPDGAEPRQFEISRVLAEDWVLADTPFDSRFD